MLYAVDEESFGEPFEHDSDLEEIAENAPIEGGLEKDPASNAEISADPNLLSTFHAFEPHLYQAKKLVRAWNEDVARTEAERVECANAFLEAESALRLLSGDEEAKKVINLFEILNKVLDTTLEHNKKLVTDLECEVHLKLMFQYTAQQQSTAMVDARSKWPIACG